MTTVAESVWKKKESNLNPLRPGAMTTIIYAKNRVREMKDAGVELKLFQSGDDESVYLFPASDLDKVAEIVQARKRIVLTEEEKERRKLHMQELHKKHKKMHTNTKNNVE